MQWIQWWTGLRGNVLPFAVKYNFIVQWSLVVSLFCVSHASKMLEERRKKLASQPGKPIDNVFYCFYRTITKKVTRSFTRKFGLQSYQDLSSVSYSFIRLMIENCFKNHFTCTITHQSERT